MAYIYFPTVSYPGNWLWGFIIIGEITREGKKWSVLSHFHSKEYFTHAPSITKITLMLPNCTGPVQLTIAYMLFVAQLSSICRMRSSRSTPAGDQLILMAGIDGWQCHNQWLRYPQSPVSSPVAISCSARTLPARGAIMRNRIWSGCCRWYGLLPVPAGNNAVEPMTTYC